MAFVSVVKIFLIVCVLPHASNKVPSIPNLINILRVESLNWGPRWRTVTSAVSEWRECGPVHGLVTTQADRAGSSLGNGSVTEYTPSETSLEAHHHRKVT